VPLLLAAAFACAAFLAAPAHAAEGPPDWAYAIAHELMSPFCPGRTLAECPSPQASELKFWILNQAAAGASEAEVREMLAERFGDVLLAAPRAEGWGLSAYAVPILALVIGLPVVLITIRRLTAPGEPVSDPSSHTARSAVDPELERELERELSEY